jgi:protein-S-isoprenylcysteine O-methyltransferase Ste14
MTVEGLIIAIVVAMILSLSLLLKVQAKTSIKLGLALARALVFFIIIYLPLIDQPRISGNIALPIIGTIILLFGIILTVLSSRELLKTEFHGGKAGALPEKIIRHPVNLGFMSTFAGWYFAWSGVYSLFLFPILIIVFIVETFWEERNLEEIFGDEYKKYKKEVGMFIPNMKSK